MKTKLKIKEETAKRSNREALVAEYIEQKRAELLMELMQTAFLKGNSEHVENSKLKLK